ncbi:MAG TPA: hypothetical protein VE439_03515, partial [Anaerolineae bacterium]|nr:hypothetical protein [Anaerolineae bacterium]
MAASWGSIAKLAGLSVIRFSRLVMVRSLHRRRDRVGELYWVDREPYEVFRETVCDGKTSGNSNVLVAGFRLQLLRSHPLLHWMFQRLCILTTPFW